MLRAKLTQRRDWFLPTFLVLLAVVGLVAFLQSPVEKQDPSRNDEQASPLLDKQDPSLIDQQVSPRDNEQARSLVDEQDSWWDDEAIDAFGSELQGVVVNPQALAGMTGREVFAATCAKCHGEKAQGVQEIGAPSLAGLPAWYVMGQIGKFKTDMRGHVAGDTSGSLMRVVAKSVETSVFEKTAAYTASLPPFKISQATWGDLEKGKDLYAAHCMSCHRYNGSGEVVFKSPPLTILPAWYLKEQMGKFSTGLRGTHPDDVQGDKMMRAMTMIKSEDDTNNVLAYIAMIAHKKWPTHRRARTAP